MAAPAKSKPATKPHAEPAYAAAPTEDDDREQRLLDLATISNPIISRVREGISKGRNWKWFSNDRTWRKTPSLVDKQLRDEAAALIQSLLKGGQ